VRAVRVLHFYVLFSVKKRKNMFFIVSQTRQMHTSKKKTLLPSTRTSTRTAWYSLQKFSPTASDIAKFRGAERDIEFPRYVENLKAGMNTVDNKFRQLYTGPASIHSALEAAIRTCSPAWTASGFVPFSMKLLETACRSASETFRSNIHHAIQPLILLLKGVNRVQQHEAMLRCLQPQPNIVQVAASNKEKALKMYEIALDGTNWANLDSRELETEAHLLFETPSDCFWALYWPIDDLYKTLDALNRFEIAPACDVCADNDGEDLEQCEMCGSMLHANCSASDDCILCEGHGSSNSDGQEKNGSFIEAFPLANIIILSTIPCSIPCTCC
jgi:hypothetical protein